MTAPPDLRQHWDDAYSSSPMDRTGWYEAIPEESLEFIAHCGLQPSDRIADIGCGNSTLIPALIKIGYRDLVAVDISQVALDSLRDRLGEESGYVRFVSDDLAHPREFLEYAPIMLWHDRAMLHFLINEADRAAYRSALTQMLVPGGRVILAAFANDGAEYCSGLPVHRYDEAGLDAFLGPSFCREGSARYVYTQPSGGLRPYVYARYLRTD